MQNTCTPGGLEKRWAIRSCHSTHTTCHNSHLIKQKKNTHHFNLNSCAPWQTIQATGKTFAATTLTQHTVIQTASPSLCRPGVRIITLLCSTQLHMPATTPTNQLGLQALCTAGHGPSSISWDNCPKCSVVAKPDNIRCDPHVSK